MRIARLDLARYGRFSDHVIDFGPAPAGGPDFHIVYGLNEAGKSTAAAAILDLLFGIEKQSPFGAAEARANWHAYSAMRIGARIEIGARPHEIARLKRDRNSLVDADNRPIDETFLKAELAGVDRASFRMMFSLDDDSLEKGGEAILASRGDLGQLLFSASAGLAEFSGRLGALRERAEKFYRPRASKTELAEKKRALEALKDERDKADTLASSYADLIRQRDEAKAAYEAAAKALSERRARSGAIQRLLAALPHLAALSRAEARLAPLADLPATPSGWEAEVARLQAEAIRLTAQKESAESAIGGLCDELDRIADDAAALQAASRVDAWRELRSRYDTARDIPVRQGELDGKRGAVAEILRRLGRPDEAELMKLILPVRTVGRIEELIAQRSGVLAKVEAARAALDEANSALAALVDGPQSDSAGAPLEGLKTRLQAARRDDSPARLRAARAEMEKQARKLLDALAALAPWRGLPEALADVSVPGEVDTAALRQRLSQALAERQNHVQRLADKNGEAERLKAEAAAATAEIVGDDAAAEIRSAREGAWAAHRAALSASSADTFEAAMRRDDAAGAARLANAREVAAARERAIKLAGLEVERARAKSDLDEADTALNALDHEIAALMPAPPPRGRDPLSFLDAWRAGREVALEIVKSIAELKDDARRANEDAERVRLSLGEAMRGAGVAHASDAPLESLVEAAEAAVAEAARTEAQRQTVKQRRVEAKRAEAKLKAALEEDERWRAGWRETCAGSWLAEPEGEPPLNVVRQALKALEELRVALNDAAELEHRIVAMERDKGLFAAEVADVAKALESRRKRRRPRGARRCDRGAGDAGARGRTQAAREDEGARGGAGDAGAPRRSACAQRQARLRDDRVLRRRRACRSRGQACRLQAARCAHRRSREGNARHPGRQCRERVRCGPHGSRERRPRRAGTGTRRPRDPR